MVKELIQSLNGVLLGKSEAVELLVMALLADGHVLVEDVPGTGKTTLSKALAAAIGADFARIQFTPDLLPADVTGGAVFKANTGDFEIRKGPVFTQVLLADEINRASPRTQSALLEAMEERQVSLEGERYKLPELFMVLATENPVEFHGVFPLPEAQMDRFMLKVIIGYPKKDEEQLIVRQNIQRTFPKANKILSTDEIVKAREVVKDVYMDEKIERYIVDIVFATRYPEEYGLDSLKEMISFGGSPRASISLSKAAKAYAFIKRRGYVVPEDVRAVCHDVLRHRIGLTYQAEAENLTTEDIINEILNKVEVP